MPNQNNLQDDVDQSIAKTMNQVDPDQSGVNNFLNVIRQIESSGGKNLNHPEIQSGIQAGDSAIGQYGLMPNTIQEIAKQSPDRNISSLSTLPKDQLADTIQQDPSAENAIAQTLARKVMQREGDPAMAAYAWNQGTHLTPQQIVARNFESSPYVQKFNKLRQRFGF